MIYVKDVTMESVNDSIFSLSGIFNVAPIPFQAINEITVLTFAVHNRAISLIIV